MSSREERRAKLKAKMQHDSQDKGKGGKNRIFDFSDYDDVNFYKTIKGKNQIDIFPFEITSKNDPTGTPIGDDNYKLEYWQHSNIGPEDSRVLCLLKTFGKPCSICEERDIRIASLEAEKVAEPWKDKEVAALKPKRRCIYNVEDTNDTEKGMQLFDHNWAHFEKELFAKATYKNPDFVMFADFDEGYTIEFRGTQSDFSEKYIEPKDFDFEPRGKFDEKEIRTQTFPFDAMLIVPTYEEVQAIFMGMENEEEEKDIPETKTEPAPRKSKAKTETKEEPKPARRGRKAKEEPEPEPENEGPVCPVEKDVGLIIGTDWDTSDACEKCPDETYNACNALFDELEIEKAAAKKKAEEAKTEKEEKPARRPRRR